MMRRLLSPLQGLMASLTIREKLTLAAGLLSFPVLALLAASLLSIHAKGVRIEQGMRAAETVKALRPLVAELQTHRGLATALRTGNHSVRKQQFESQRRIDRLVESIDSTYAADIDAPTWQQIKQSWVDLRAATPRAPLRDLVDQHGRLIDRILHATETVGHTSGLLRSNHAGTYGLAHMAVTELPTHGERLARLNAWATSTAARIRAGTRDRFRMTDLNGMVRDSLAGLENRLQLLEADAPSTALALNAAARTCISRTRAFLRLLDQRATAAGRAFVSSQDLTTFGRVGLEKTHELNETSLVALDGLLDRRLTYVHRQELLIAAAAVVLLAAAAYVCMGVYRSIQDAARTIQQAAEQLSVDAVDRPADTHVRDELLIAARRLNNHLGSLEPMPAPETVAEADVPPPPPPEQRSAPVLDRTSLQTRVGGDPEALLDLVSRFQGETRQILEDLRTGINKGDADTLQRSARQLSGSLRAVAATAACAAALRLEAAARIGDLGQARHVMNTLEAEIARLEPELSALGK